jgi:hypothetical protein
MNENIKQLAEQANIHFSRIGILDGDPNGSARMVSYSKMEKFAQLIVKEMCGMMGQTEDDCYHCFDAGERPTEYIEWLRHWQEIFTRHFGVEE